MKLPFPIALVFLVSAAAAGPEPGPASPGYRLVDRYYLGGVGSYDYVRVDPALRRIFVTHQTRVEVVAADTGRLLGAITGLQGVHGVALATELGRGFISNGLSGAVTVFDLATLRITATIQTSGKKPDAIEYDPATKLVWVSNGRSNDASLIDAVAGKVVRTVALAGNPESAVFDGRGRAFVNLESCSSVARVDLAAGRVEAQWSVAPGDGPTGLAADREHGRLFVGCGANERLVVLNADSGAQVAVLSIGDDCDAVGFDAGTHQVFASARDGTLTVIQQDDPDHYHVLATVATQFGAKTLAVDPASHRAFLPVAKFGPSQGDKPGPIVPDTFELLIVGM